MNASKEQAHEASDRLYAILAWLNNSNLPEMEKLQVRAKLHGIGDFISACKSKLPCEKSYEKQRSRK